MKSWYRPIKTVKEEIAEPIRHIAAIAIAALIMAGLALFISLGKGSNAAA